ncbi:integral membrane protein [Zea mays]|uniref:Integral membrane protein n=1 Tax=Zea mays TaxID=4577 RepID=A0A1D6NRG5_MAIZE|nr:integral membrane protein [Zea mays]
MVMAPYSSRLRKDMPVTKADLIDVLCDYIMTIQDDTTLESHMSKDEMIKDKNIIWTCASGGLQKHYGSKYKIAYNKKRSGWALFLSGTYNCLVPWLKEIQRFFEGTCN